jgi:hypothetical protein
VYGYFCLVQYKISFVNLLVNIDLLIYFCQFILLHTIQVKQLAVLFVMMQ